MKKTRRQFNRAPNPRLWIANTALITFSILCVAMVSTLSNTNPFTLPDQTEIARMNLSAAEHLPANNQSDFTGLTSDMDKWANQIGKETVRNAHQFRENASYYYNSEAFYKMLMMAVVLYEDYHVQYNPKWIASPDVVSDNDHFFADSRNLFIHGLLGPDRMGTCSSMPVLYVALGRRLGYPLKLVRTKGHLFIRWESPTETFNMDATAKGIERYDDEHYKHWPFELTEQEIQDEKYLKSLSPQEELAVFLTIRGACLKENGRLAEAKEAFQKACELAPDWKGNRVLLASVNQESAAAPRSRAARTLSRKHSSTQINEPNPVFSVR
jgi:hypothetical protein